MANDKMTKIAIKFTRMFCTSFSSSFDRLRYLQYATSLLKLLMPSILLTSVRTIFFTIADAISLHDFDNYHQLL